MGQKAKYLVGQMASPAKNVRELAWCLVFILSPRIWKNLIPLLLHNLCFLYTVGIITCWVCTNSFPTNKNDDPFRPQVSSVWNISQTGSSQSVISDLVFLVPTIQRKIHLNIRFSVKSKYNCLVLFRGKDISSSICLLGLSSLFLPCFSVSSRWGKLCVVTNFWRPHYWDLFHVYTYKLIDCVFIYRYST